MGEKKLAHFKTFQWKVKWKDAANTPGENKWFLVLLCLSWNGDYTYTFVRNSLRSKVGSLIKFILSYYYSSILFICFLNSTFCMYNSPFLNGLKRGGC